MKPRKRMYIIPAAILLIISACTSALFGILLGKIIDSVGSKDLDIFFKLLVLIIIIILLDMICNIFGWKFVYLDSIQQVEKIKNILFNKELKKGRECDIDIAGFSSKTDLILDDWFINNWLIFNNIVVFIFSSIAIIATHWAMFFVSIVVSLIPLITPIFFQGHVQKKSKQYSEESTFYLNYVTDILNGRLEIAKYNTQNIYQKKHEDKNHNFENKRYQMKFVNRSTNKLTENIGNLTFVIVFLVGGILIYNDMLAVGGLITVIQLMNSIVGPIVSISEYQNEKNACRPIYEELSEEIEENNNILLAEEKELDLIVNNLSFLYPNTKKKIINSFNYIFKQGKKYLILGESGSGKTTLAKILSGELSSYDGEIQLGNNNIVSLSDNSIIKRICYVDQKPYIFQDTILHNIDMYRDIENEKIRKIISDLGLESMDLNQVVKESDGISGGQKSRICLARAAVALPNFLIVDEPTSALDLVNARRVMKFLSGLPCTVIVITHNTDKKIMEMFDEVINLTSIK